LGLSRTSVTDDFLKRLTTLKRLKTLELYRTNVTWIGITELEESIPKLRVSATPPFRPSPPCTMWIAFAAIPVFLFTFVSFGRVFVTQFGNIMQLKTASARGEVVTAASLTSNSTRNGMYSAAQGVGMFFGLIGGSFVVSGIGDVTTARSTTSWSSVDGVVVVSRVIRDAGMDADAGDIYKPVIIYRYSVDGTDYTGDHVAAYRLSNNRSEVIDQEFPAGPVTVHFNPADPSEAVLKPGTAMESYIPVGLGSMALLIGLTLFCGVHVQRRRWKQKTLNEQFGRESAGLAETPS
jgi:hypothetical protein